MEGKTVKQAAIYFNVSPSAISQAKRNLNIAVIKNVAMESAARVVDRSLDTVDQLRSINRRANELLTQAEQDPELSLKCMAKIRQQLRLQLEIISTLYDMNVIKEFQEAVLKTIGEIEPNAREKIIQRLYHRRAIRQAIECD